MDGGGGTLVDLGIGTLACAVAMNGVGKDAFDMIRTRKVSWSRHLLLVADVILPPQNPRVLMAERDQDRGW
jgi:hypothetical protein